ncbi:MAG TPA: efflux RND transporter periplasmic adaptor subunit [Kofleriaceae bacterium]|nr:efflux RND transporter periplasmic adaptor subunit [Kofleriaceae bacterium]
MRALGVFLAIGCAAACSKTAPAAESNGPMPPAEVTVVTIKPERVALATELPGRTTVSLASEVRPQITGIVKARTFEEGARVKAGQVLYQIEPAQYQAAYEGAKADLASAQAMLESAKIRDERYAGLLKIEGVSKEEADDARLAHAQAQANVAQKTAALELARINLGWTSITAPISGTIGKSSVTPGALVTANQATPLATIRSLDPIYVDLTESSEQRLKLRGQVGAGKLEAGSTNVKLLLPDGSTYERDGKLEFAEVAVDEATGMVTLRAKFPNPDGTLLPGMYVRAVLDEAVEQNAILAPQQGVSHDAKGNASAMVVGADGKAELRTIVATRAIGDRWLVESGLKAGDQLIVEGLNKIGPGMPVHANEKTEKK